MSDETKGKKGTTKRSTVKFMNLEADDWMGPSIFTRSSESAEDDEFAKFKKEKIHDRIVKLKELEADKWLSDAENELTRGKSGAPVDQSILAIVQPLLVNPEVQKQWLEKSPAERMALAQSVNMMTQRGTDTGSLGAMFPMMLAMQGNGKGASIEDVSKIYLAGVENSAKNNAAQRSPVEIMEQVNNMIKPYRDQLDSMNKLVWETQIKRLEDKIVDPREYFKTLRQDAEEFGYTRGGGESAERLVLENKKEEYAEKWRTIQYQDVQGQNRIQMVVDGIKSIFGDSVGQIVKGLGGAAVDKVRGGITGGRPPADAISIECPYCQTQFYAPPDARTLRCPNPKCNKPLSITKIAPENAPGVPQNGTPPSQQQDNQSSADINV